MPMYVMDDRLHAQDGVVGTSCPILVRRQSPPRHQLAGHLSAKAKTALLGSGPVRMRDGQREHTAFPVTQRREGFNSIAARSLITQMETVKVQSAELRHFGVEREWGDTHHGAQESGADAEWAAKTELSVHCQEFGRPSVAVPCLTTSCELTLLYASLLEEYTTVVKKSPSSESALGRAAPIHHQGRRLGKVMFSVEECSDLPPSSGDARRGGSHGRARGARPKTNQGCGSIHFVPPCGQPGGVLYSPHERPR
jgi:hypothetical protein